MTESNKNKLEESLRSVLEAVSSATSADFFPAMARELRRELAADAVGISELINRDRARVLAFALDGSIRSGMIYDLAGTPCADILPKRVCLHRSGFSRLFPGMVFGQDDQYEGFAGVPLFGMDQKPVGTMFALFTHPFADDALAGSVLEIFSTRVASEIERMNAEKALRESEQLYRDLVETSQDLVWKCDRDGRFTFLNKSWEQVFGYSVGDMLNQRFPDFQSPEAALRDRTVFNKLLTGDAVIGHETSCRSRTGEEIHLVLNARPIRDAEGIIAGAQGAAFNFTRHKQADEALRESENLLRESQRAGLIGSYAYDIARDYWKSSTMLDEIFGITGAHPRDLKGWLSLVHPDDREAIARYVENSIRIGRRFDREYRILRPGDKQERWVHGQGDFEFAVDGTIARMKGVIQDITERKSSEARLNQAQKMEAIGQLAGGVAHDFNNILSAVMGYASLLSIMEIEDETVRDYVQQIKETTERGASLTRSLLAFGRKQEICFRPIDLNAVIRSSEKMISRLIGEDIHLALDLDPANPEIVGDSNQIHQVLINLCTNARDAMPGGGALRIETSAPGADEVSVTVRDSGIGIMPGAAKQIFEPFFTTKRPGRGSGLGLSIVYGIVQKHQGAIVVESEPGKGAAFHVNFPRVQGGRRAVPDRSNRGVPRGSGTILLMEDEESVRRSMKLVLEAHGFIVVEAEDGAQGVALFKARGREIDLLLCDLVMPNQNGREAYEEIRKIKPGIPAIFLSGYTGDVFEAKGIVDEDLHLLTKPIMPPVLIQKITETLGRITAANCLPGGDAP